VDGRGKRCNWDESIPKTPTQRLDRCNPTMRATMHHVAYCSNETFGFECVGEFLTAETVMFAGESDWSEASFRHSSGADTVLLNEVKQNFFHDFLLI